VAHWTEVERIAMSLPEMTSHIGRNGIRQWKVGDKPVAWERPLRGSDHEALGDSAPDGPILGVRTADIVAKDSIECANKRGEGACMHTRLNDAVECATRRPEGAYLHTEPGA
jgi:hypothetical protein